MKNIVIVDYGMGNLTSVSNAIGYLKYSPVISSDRDTIAAADAYILPGVGAFAMAMKNLGDLDLIDVLNENVTVKKKPILGICLGMQLVSESSTEMGLHPGLGWIEGQVRQIDGDAGLRVPHVGWNEIRIRQESQLFARMPSLTHFYFDHSYHLVCDPRNVVALCDYGDELVAAIRQDNIFAVQFHPEKSQTAGLKLLRNYLNLVEADGC